MEIKLTCNTEPIIVKQGEYGETLSIDCKEWVGDFGEGTITWLMQRPNDEEPYVLDSTEEGTVTSVVLSAYETEVVGKGNIELSYTNENETFRTISRTLDFVVLPSLFGSVPTQNLVYEEGTAVFEELTDGKFRIPFSKPHDTLPFFYIVQETDTEYTEDCIVLCAIMNYEAALGVAPEAPDRSIYGTYTKLRFASSLSRITGTTGNMTSKTGDTAESLSSWVTTEEILANDFKGNPTLSYTVGHQYKWFAVWNPAVKEIESEENEVT